ncbi:cell division protein ZapD [Sulfuriferula sp. AH1]|nr:cell division protein ZapD [Sulfuriferula sp. AH1]
MIHYEYPLSERVRTLLRLESLFHKALYFVTLDDPLPHHTALLAIFEIIEVAARADLKSDILQELERQRQSLESLRRNAAIDQDKLSEILTEINHCLKSIHGLAGKLGQHLKEYEWLLNVKQRAGIPGGTCGFDLPAYHYWLHSTTAKRRDDLNAWITPMLPIYHGLSVVLKLLRESGLPQPAVAIKGAYQQMLGGRNAQLLKISLNQALPCVPEASANKYALSIRFMAVTQERPSQCTENIEFNLTFCNL